MKKTPYIRSLSAALALLIMISLLPFASCGTKAVKQDNKTGEPNATQANASPEDIQAQLAQTQEPRPPSPQAEAIAGLAGAGAVAQALAADPAKAASDTEALKASVEENAAKLAGTLSGTRDKLAELGLSAKQERFEATSAKLSSDISSLRESASGLTPEDPASYSALAQRIDEMLASPEPAILSSELSHLTEPDTPVPPTYGASIAPAYLSGAPGLTPSSLPAEPGDEDLAETPDAPQSEEIIALADQLNHDPVAIYEWVRNNIDFESYYGSRKGALGTLAEQAGNSTDTASLLIALLRASGIPARYVTGVIELNPDQACSWLATDSISDAQSLLASGGIPVTGIIEGGAVSRLQLTHTYTEAWVNYENYRGADGGEGPSDWIPLDASYKTYEVSYPQVDILAAMGEGYETLSQEYLATVREETFLSFIEAKIKTWLAANMPQLTLADVMRTKSIRQENLGLLPPDLLYTLVSAESEERELAPSSRWRATLTLAGATLTCDFVSLASGTLEASFTPATEEDEALLAAYENITDIPAYLLDMTGEITAGENTAQAQASPFGSSSSWSLAISSPGRSYQINNTLTWGAPFSVSLEREPSPVNQNLAMQTSASFPHCLFNQTASTYISHCASDDRDLAGLFGLTLTRGTQEASVGLSLSPQCVSGVPVSATPDGVYIDAHLSTATPAGKTGVTRRDFTLASGLSGSAYEHLVLEECFSSDAVSTARLISLANVCEVPVLTLDRSNWTSLSPTLELPAYIKSQMADAVQAGYTVTTPAQPGCYMDCVFEGWMVTDPQTGEGAYLISGGLAGGKTIALKKEDELEQYARQQGASIVGVEIISPEYNANFLLGETIEVNTRWKLSNDGEISEYDTSWELDTSQSNFIPGRLKIYADIKRYNAPQSVIEVNLFALLKMGNDGMWIPPTSEQVVTVKAVNLNGSSISGFYSPSPEEKKAEVDIIWEWEQDSFDRGARFLPYEGTERDVQRDEVLGEDGIENTNIKPGLDSGEYQLKAYSSCPYFIPWGERELALNQREFNSTSDHPLVFRLQALPGVKKISEIEVRILDLRNDDPASPDYNPSDLDAQVWDKRIDWGKIVGIKNSGEEDKNALGKFIIGVRIEFEEDGDQNASALIPDDFQLPVTISSHIQGEYDCIASIAPRAVYVHKVINSEVDQGPTRQVYFASEAIDPLNENGDGIYINQSKDDDVDEYTTINALEGPDYYGYRYSYFDRGCNKSDMKFARELSDQGFTKRGLVSVLYTTGSLSEKLTQDTLKEQEILTFGDELKPAKPISYRDYHTVNLLRAGGGVEIIEVKLDISECQTGIAQPQTDKVLAKNPTDWLYTQAHGANTGVLSNSGTNEGTSIYPPLFDVTEKDGSIVIEYSKSSISQQVFVDSLSEVDKAFFFGCLTTKTGPGMNTVDGGVCWMATGAHHILGYWEEVHIDTADNVVDKLFNNNPIPLENIELKWLLANSGDNNSGDNTSLACALSNSSNNEVLRDIIDNKKTYESIVLLYEDLKTNIFMGYYFLVKDLRSYKELSFIFDLPFSTLKPQEWDIDWIQSP